jgi:hypothetical protein
VAPKRLLLQIRHPLERMAVPKERGDRGPPAVLPANPTFEGAGVGAKMLITDPCSPLARPWWWWANGMPPLWQYLWPLLGGCVHSGPQRARTPDPRGPFPCKLRTFVGATKGAMMRFVDPS